MPPGRFPRTRQAAAMAARDRAVRRVARLTMAAALAGVAGSVGFAGLAAATYSGNPSPTTAAIGESQGNQVVPQTGSAPQTITAPTPIQVAQPPTRTRGRARVTAGGS